ncbi:FAS1-like dehydratase domain-containing protein [Jatrophihabitans fulvus]
MPVDASYAGRTFPPTDPYRVSREKIREFADAINDPNPVYRDAGAARAAGHADVLAPPTFATRLTLEAAAVVIADPDFGLDFSRVVHGEERYEYHRPIAAGDELEVVTTVDSIRAVAGNDMVGLRFDVRTTDGEPVTTARMLLVGRGEDA